ncbi:MAG TPA: sulfatase-like hydrolase/transferase [Sedimentisphaerales bacterium]|nr:sulfatase-like hydrolase/transferase [Sedimentisphaerales bacterium]
MKATRRQFLKTTGLTAASTAAFSFLQGCANTFERSPRNAVRDKPNIILIMADDLGYGDVGFNGNKIIKTPQLDEMAKAGIRFTRFYAGGPVCSPTRGTCLTGRHYFRYGIFSASVGYLPAEEMTIARMCKSLGYATGHFGKWHLAPVSKTGPTMPEYEENRLRKYAPPWERDYDETFTTECNVPTWNPAENLESYKWVFRLPFWHNGQIETENLKGPAARVVMERAIPFIRKAAANKQPFFATVWFHEPHEPVVAGPEYRAVYSQYSEGEQHYYGCITAMDEQIGRLRKELRDLRVAENTMVWFCSDNGPEGMTSGGEQNWCRNSRGVTGGLRGRKRSLFDGGLVGPALLEWPGHAQPGRVVDIPCSTVDYLPTIQQLLGYKMPDDRPIDGINLLPLVNGKMKKRPKPIPFWFVKPSKKAMHGSPTLALVDNSFKFLTDLSEDGDEELLFDLAKDPGEEHNIITEYRDKAGAMREHLKKWTESCRRSHSGADYPTAFTPVDKFPIISGAWNR